MRKSIFVAILLALCGAVAVPAVGADEGKPKKERPPSKSALKKFDKDGDGQLNAEEKAAWEADKAEKAEKKKAKAAEKAEKAEKADKEK